MKLPSPFASAPAALWLPRGGLAALGLLLALSSGLALPATPPEAAAQVLTLESEGRAHPREAAAQLGSRSPPPPEEIERGVVNPPVLPAAYEYRTACRPEVVPPAETEQSHCAEEGGGLAAVGFNARAPEQPREAQDVGGQDTAVDRV